MVTRNLTKAGLKLTRQAAFVFAFWLGTSVISVPVANAQFAFGSHFFGTPMFSAWDEADLAKSGTKGYFGGRLTLPEGANKWPEEFQEQLKQYKISHFASRETIHENEVPAEIKSFPYYEVPTLSTDSVKIQMKRVARERGITEEQLEELINKHEKRSQWAVFLDPWINIQELNRELDEVFPFPVPEPKPVEVVKTQPKKRTQVVLRKAKKSTTAASSTKTAKAVKTSNTKTAKTTKTPSKNTTASKSKTKQVANKTLKSARG